MPAKPSLSSNAKGKAFEGLVADLYRLLGAEVIQNVEICQKKVDILATFRLPGSLQPHRIIVEAKNESRTRDQNQRVMQFKGLLDMAREMQEAESAEIVTRKPWSDAAKGFALRSGITVQTYSEKIARLLDFSEYLRHLVRRFDEGDPAMPGQPAIGRYYVDVAAELHESDRTTSIPDLKAFVQDWIIQDGSRHLALLGEFGTGKSSFCLSLARDLASAWLHNPGDSRIPILLNLRDFTKALKIEALVTSFMDEECGVATPRYRLFEMMNEAGLFTIILDGFDEMAVRVDADTLEANLQEIEKLSAHPNSRVILTSRTEYFVNSTEETNALQPRGNPLASRNATYSPVWIVPWDEKKIELFIKRRIALIPRIASQWRKYKNKIFEMPELLELSHRPVLLDMIVRTLPELVASGITINKPNLYDTYLRSEIKRQKVNKKRALLLTEDTRFGLMQLVSSGIFSGDIKELNFSESLRICSSVLALPRDELEFYTRDFLGCSFLKREGDSYSFSHRSIMEYLVAKELQAECENSAPNLWRKCPVTPVIAEFLSELKIDQRVLWKWIDSTRSSSHVEAAFLGGNSITMLNYLSPDNLRGADLSNTYLFEADLSGADLQQTNFTNTVCIAANLISSLLTREMFHAMRSFEGHFSVAVAYKQGWPSDVVLNNPEREDGGDPRLDWAMKVLEPALSVPGEDTRVEAIGWMHTVRSPNGTLRHIPVPLDDSQICATMSVRVSSIGGFDQLLAKLRGLDMIEVVSSFADDALIFEEPMPWFASSSVGRRARRMSQDRSPARRR